MTEILTPAQIKIASLASTGITHKMLLDSHEAMREQLAESQDDVRALVQAIEVAKAAHVEMTCLDDEAESCLVCEPLHTVLARPGVKRVMEEQDATASGH